MSILHYRVYSTSIQTDQSGYRPAGVLHAALFGTTVVALCGAPLAALITAAGWDLRAPGCTVCGECSARLA